MKKLLVNGGLVPKGTAPIGAALIGAMLVLAFMACPDAPKTGPKTPPSDSVVITEVTIGGGEPVSPALSSGNAVLGSSTPRPRYELPVANMQGSVTLSVTRNDAGQTISWAKVAANVFTPPANTPFTEFARPASGNVLSAVVSATNGLANNEKIYIKVVAADKTTVLYYGFTIYVGNVARLAGLSLGGTAVTTWSETGEKALWNNIDVVGAFYRDEAPAGGSFALAASAEEGGAIAYAVTTNSEEEPSYTALTGTPDLSLATGSILYIKVTSANGSVSVTHKIRIFLKASATVLYGQPVISSGVSGNAPVLDSLWDTQNWVFSINRLNLAELTPEFRFLNTPLYFNKFTGIG